MLSSFSGGDYEGFVKSVTTAEMLAAERTRGGERVRLRARGVHAIVKCLPALRRVDQGQGPLDGTACAR